MSALRNFAIALLMLVSATLGVRLRTDGGAQASKASFLQERLPECGATRVLISNPAVKGDPAVHCNPTDNIEMSGDEGYNVVCINIRGNFSGKGSETRSCLSPPQQP